MNKKYLDYFLAVFFFLIIPLIILFKDLESENRKILIIVVMIWTFAYVLGLNQGKTSSDDEIGSASVRYGLIGTICFVILLFGGCGIYN
jgi:hypothetical protein